VIINVLQKFKVNESKVTVAANEICSIFNKSAADCSILFKFGTELDHVTPDVLQTLKVKCQNSMSQRKNVVQSPNNCSILGNRGS